MRGEKSGQEIRTHFEIHDKTASDDVIMGTYVYNNSSQDGK